MKKLYAMMLMLAALVIGMQFSSPHSKQSREKPEVNFYGSLVYPDGQEVAVENITIYSMIRDIVVYQKPAISSAQAQKSGEKIEIEQNRTRIELNKICQINTLNPHIEYNNRIYVEIEVIANDPHHTRNTFLIEQRKEISCDLIKTGFVKEVSFSAIKSLKIKGQKPQPTPMPYQPTACPDTNAIPDDNDYLITKTNFLLQELETKSKQLPKNSLGESIQNMLHDLKNTIKNIFSTR